MLSNKEFGKRLKGVINENGYTLAQFARENYISRVMIYRYVDGTSMPYVEMLAYIAEKLGVSMDWLCGISDKKVLDSNFSNVV